MGRGKIKKRVKVTSHVALGGRPSNLGSVIISHEARIRFHTDPLSNRRLADSISSREARVELPRQQLEPVPPNEGTPCHPTRRRTRAPHGTMMDPPSGTQRNPLSSGDCSEEDQTKGLTGCMERKGGRGGGGGRRLDSRSPIRSIYWVLQDYNECTTIHQC